FVLVVAVTSAWSVVVAFAPLRSLPSVHVTVVVPLHEPCDGVALTNCSPAGSGSITTTFVAVDGPAFATVIVYDTVLPVVVVVAPVVFVSERSAEAGSTGTAGAEVVPLPAFGSDVALEMVALLMTEPL